MAAAVWRRRGFGHQRARPRRRGNRPAPLGWKADLQPLAGRFADGGSILIRHSANPTALRSRPAHPRSPLLPPGADAEPARGHQQRDASADPALSLRPARQARPRRTQPALPRTRIGAAPPVADPQGARPSSRAGRRRAAASAASRTRSSSPTPPGSARSTSPWSPPCRPGQALAASSARAKGARSSRPGGRGTSAPSRPTSSSRSPTRTGRRYLPSSSWTWGRCPTGG